MTTRFAAMRSVVIAIAVTAAMACARPADPDSRPTADVWLWVARDATRHVTDVRPRDGSWLPFIDRDGDGAFDPFIDDAGYCTGGELGECLVPPLRVDVRRLVQGGLLTASAGILVTAHQRGPHPRGVRNTLPICLRGGPCSALAALPYWGFEQPIENLWVCTDHPESAHEPEQTMLTVGDTDISLPPHTHQALVVHPLGDSTYRVDAQLPVDLFAARVVRMADGRVFDEVRSADGGGGRVQPLTATRFFVKATAPADCAGCALLIQAAHLWRDDWIQDRSDAWHAVALGDS